MAITFWGSYPMAMLVPLFVPSAPRVYAPAWTVPILDALAPVAKQGDAAAHRVLGWWTKMRDDSIGGMPPDADEWLRWGDTARTLLRGRGVSLP